ncbi:UNVERIFIED_CONTAM: putative MO25-like protein [Sesamum calycinum]|uniref:MO25-like protein n=1 Tax=Sesamum calycinum TaxID=2727403 RepID=A0AAW2Q569_9LAMI
MKNPFKSKKPRTPVDIVRETRALLLYFHSGDDAGNPKRDEKLEQLDANIRELKSILYGIDESEPVPEACAQLTQEFFKEDTMRLLINCLPKLNFEARKDASRVIANLQRQPVHSRLIAADYLEANLDIMDQLITGYEDPVVALHFGGMLRECIRHQVVARYVLKPEHVKKFFDYIQLPNFDVASDAAATFKELMTRHKSTIADFLAENYTWFFAEFNSKLLESTNYMTRRHAVKLLGDILLDRSNAGSMIRYVSSKDNMRVLMNLLRESHKSIQIDAFHVFKLFVANQNKPADIVNILCANRTKLLRFLTGFNMDKEDEMFEADKAQAMTEDCTAVSISYATISFLIGMLDSEELQRQKRFRRKHILPYRGDSEETGNMENEVQILMHSFLDLLKDSTSKTMNLEVDVGDEGVSKIQLIERTQFQMVVCFEATPKKLAATAALFLTGGTLFGYGLHLWHVNAAPQQARIKARNDFVRERLRKKYGKP